MGKSEEASKLWHNFVPLISDQTSVNSHCKITFIVFSSCHSEAVVQLCLTADSEENVHFDSYLKMFLELFQFHFKHVKSVSPESKILVLVLIW